MQYPLIVFALLWLISEARPGFADEKPLAITQEFGHDLFAISPDGKQLALYGSGSFRIADAATGKVIRADDRNAPTIYQMIWISDGLQILGVGDGIQVRDAKSLKIVQSMETPEPIWRCALSPDEKRLAAGQPNGDILILDWKARKTVAVLHGHKARPNGLKWTRKGDRLLSAGGFGDTEILTWDVEHERVVGRLPVAKNEVNWFGWTADDSQLIVLSDRESLKIRDMASGREVRTLAGARSAQTAAVSHDGKTVVSSDEYDLLFWDAQGKSIARWQRHDDVPNQIEYSGDGALLITGGGRSIFVWNVGGSPSKTVKPMLTSGEESHSLSCDAARVQQVSFSPNGRWLAAAVDTEPVAQVYVWNAQSRELYEKLPAGSGPLLDAHFRDDNKLVYQHNSGDVVVWEPGRKKEMRRLPVSDVDRRFGFSRGRNVRLAIGSVRGEILVAKATDASTVARFPAHAEEITDVDISSNGKRVVSGSHDQTARIWNAETGELLDTLPKLPGLRMTYHAVQFAPDDSVVAAGNDGAVILWDVKQRKQLHKLVGFDGYCRCVAFSADSKWLITGGDDRMVRIWNVAEGKEAARLSGHTDMITGVSVAPDGNTLASCSFDKTVKLWDVSRLLSMSASSK